jgi:hypothetical protein
VVALLSERPLGRSARSRQSVHLCAFTSPQSDAAPMERQAEAGQRRDAARSCASLHSCHPSNHRTLGTLHDRAAADSRQVGVAEAGQIGIAGLTPGESGTDLSMRLILVPDGMAYVAALLWLNRP